MKLAYVILIFSSLAFAEQKPGHHEHREHAAHKHGAAEMSIAFEGIKGEIDFAAPGDSIYGFEYVAKKESDKKKQTEALGFLQKNISEMVRFEASLKCVITKDKIEINQSKGEKHSAVDAEFSVICEKSPVGSAITFNVQTTFPKLKSVNVKVIADDVQKSFDASQNGAKLELKK
ncbi:MAG: DUF2796 domain-containing protein [Bdellovibrio sp.]|nr:DUF2796 domain-containing protein [Bdellovibrio sp.]